MLRTCTHTDWNGWIFSYNEEIHKLSYDEYDYKIDIKIVEKNPSFQICDSLDRVMKKDWVTKEVYDGLVKAFEVLFPNACFREKAAMLRHHYWGSTEIN